MSNESLKPLYDLLKEAFDAGIEYCRYPDAPTAGDMLFPLAARMEEEVQKLIDAEREACARYADSFRKAFELEEEKSAAEDIAIAIRSRQLPFYLPSSPERET